MRLITKVLAVALGLALILSVFRFASLLKAKDPNATEKQTIQIKADSSRAEVAKQLDEAGLITSPTAFLLYLRLTKVTVQPGPYELSANQPSSAIADAIGSGDYKTVKATLLEGWRAKDIEEYLVNKKGLKQLAGFTEIGEPAEGYLFPDTYELRVDITSDGLLELLRDNFDTRTKDLKNITPDVIVLASIVEREAGANDDREQIASVYVNRLKEGMRLQADPTIQYALGNWSSITVAQYSSVVSPYNTYLNAGLPPGPISNPGFASIKAALNPDETPYLYFFTAHGETYFSKTLAEHQSKIKQYF